MSRDHLVARIEVLGEDKIRKLSFVWGVSYALCQIPCHAMPCQEKYKKESYTCGLLSEKNRNAKRRDLFVQQKSEVNAERRDHHWSYVRRTVFLSRN